MVDTLDEWEWWEAILGNCSEATKEGESERVWLVEHPHKQKINKDIDWANCKNNTIGWRCLIGWTVTANATDDRGVGGDWGMAWVHQVPVTSWSSGSSVLHHLFYTICIAFRLDLKCSSFSKNTHTFNFLPSSLASLELLACRRCYLEVVFPPHVIRCYLRVLHKGDSRCHSSRYATGAMRPPSPRKATQHDRHKKVRY